MSAGETTPPPRGEASGDGDLFPVIEWHVFRNRYPAKLLRPRALHTERVARRLRERLGMRSILGVSFYPWHDQTTLWWFEQGMLTLLAAAGWDTVWVTDARYTFDDDRLAELDGHVSIVRQRQDDPNWEPPEGHFDAVITLFPSDRATRAARILGAQLISFAIKNLHVDERPLVEPPPAGTPLWHALAGSTNFIKSTVWWMGGTLGAWRPIGAPFPTNRYYFPLRSVRPVFDALLFGSKARDYDTVFAALARAGAGRVAALVNVEDAAEVARSARRHGVDAEISEPVSHLRLLELLELSRLVVNPIMPPAESHYSLSLPLAIGRPIVVSDLAPARIFAGPGVLLAPLGDVAAWTDCISRLLRETADELPHRAALKQGLERHDVDRFFASAILATMTGDVDAGLPPSAGAAG